MNPFMSRMPSFTKASSWFEAYAAFSTFMILLRAAFNDLIRVIPEPHRSTITTKLLNFFSSFQRNNKVSLKITQFWHDRDEYVNELFKAVHEYLPSRTTRTYKSVKLGKLLDCNNLVFAVEGGEEVVDQFEGSNFTWKLNEDFDKDPISRNPHFVLTFNEKHRQKVMDKYIPHVLTTYEAIKAERRMLRLHSYRKERYWNATVLSHPATFNTVALDPDLKKAIIDDLERYLKRKEMYRKVGKPWKRGYLLYGPPGTGKSSLVAAMANYLKYDVYDLELTSIISNSDLMDAMRKTSRRSIIVIEDIDCNIEVLVRSPADDAQSDSHDVKVEAPKRERFTLSGLLNCIDGLWSSHGEERIIIFTTNHKEKIDPALLRPGRMDMHIELSFLKPKAFRILADNYFGIEDHPLFQQIEDLLEKTEVTPAAVAEQLSRNEDPDAALDQLLKFLIDMDVKREAHKPDHEN